MRWFHHLALSTFLMPAALAAGEKSKPFTARPLTAEKSFTGGVEGPACDAQGNIYAVNFAKDQTVGKVTPEGKGEIFITLPGKSTGNGIVFDRKGFMYVADYVEHKVWKVDMKTKEMTVFDHNPKMNQPNDLAIAPDDTLYASDPNWGNETGQVWMIDRQGKTHLVAEKMGTTNGIEVSPDGKTLYVNESIQRNVWSFPIKADGTLGEKSLLKKFPDHGFDGMRCDVAGNLYITRHGKGTVAVLSPKGQILHEVDVLGKYPSNLCFGGPDGKTVYVTDADKWRLVEFRVEQPGLAFQRWTSTANVEPVTKPIKLFNGKDLTNFYTYLRGLGKNKDPNGVFTVNDGMIRVSGEIFGCFTTEKEYENYHLVVEFKWGTQTFKPREKRAMDSGVLLHCVGADGAAGGVWMESIECQLIEGGTGDFILVGGKALPKMTALVEKRGNQWYYNPKGEAKLFDKGGRINWYARDPKWMDVQGFRGEHDVEKVAGEWNTLECICDGDKITNILNGTVVNVGTGASLTRGKILFQSEGAEIFFRRIDLLPLKK